MDESRQPETTAAKRPLRPQPASDESLTEELGSILNFIEHDGRPQLFEESTWVTANASLNVWILKENVLGLGEQLPEEGRLSSAARSRYHHGREMS
jgi:hypothetical protein